MRRLPLIVSALVALALTGCEDTQTVSELPTLNDSGPANEDLRNAPSNRGSGPRLAPEHDRSAAAVLSDLARLYPKDQRPVEELVGPPPSFDPGLEESVEQFVARMVRAAERRDPDLCRRYFTGAHRFKLTQATGSPTLACIGELKAAKGHIRLVGIEQIFFRAKGRSAGVLFTTQSDRRIKRHGMRLVRSNGGWRVASGATDITL